MPLGPSKKAKKGKAWRFSMAGSRKGTGVALCLTETLLRSPTVPISPAHVDDTHDVFFALLIRPSKSRKEVFKAYRLESHLSVCW